MSVSGLRSAIVRAGGLAVIGALLFAGVASADTTSGQTGDYVFTDTLNTPQATCVYAVDSNSVAHFTKMTVVAPSVWWPDTSSSSNNEHGTVGWSFILQTFKGGGWKTVKTTSVQKAVAHEDSQDPYGNSTKAKFSNLSLKVNWHHYGNANSWRVVVKAVWYKPNGHVRGSVKHLAVNYQFKVNGQITGHTTDYCVNEG